MIPHNKPSIGSEESAAITEVISSCWIAPGEKVKQFEQAFADYVGAKYAIAVNSGTAALTVALKILGRMPFIAIPTYVCSAVLNAVDMSNQQACIVDINKNDFNMEKIRVKLRPYQGVYIIPYTFGVPADVENFKIENQYIIEDCSQALGSYINGKHVGLQGDIATFSFGPSKMITTGSGGMIVTNNKALADKAREYIDYDKHIPAFNFGMNDLQAAMGIEQLKKLPEFLRKRREMATAYQDICKTKGWRYQVSINCLFSDLNWYRYIVKDNCVSRLKQHLADNGITAIIPIEQREMLHNMLGLGAENYPNAEWVAGHSLSLPIYPALTDEEFNHILDYLRSF
ncbi:MAG: DegT/DnrJ/EryC1/StrS aminotransferase family protein [Candidatus Babeliales bacterium]|jgi:perosamine synthetase